MFGFIKLNKNLAIDIYEEVNSADAVERYEIENMIFLSPENFIFEKDEIKIHGGTNMVQSDISLNYFLSDGSILETVNKGELYMTESKADSLGVEIGDKLTIELNGASCEVTLKDK